MHESYLDFFYAHRPLTFHKINYLLGVRIIEVLDKRDPDDRNYTVVFLNIIEILRSSQVRKLLR